MLKKLDKCLVICVMLLLVIGLIMIFSASNVTSYMKLDKSPYNFFIRQFIFLIGSLIISFLILRFKTRHYSKLAPTMMIGIIGLLVCVLIYGKVLNESKSWFNIFGLFTVQPSEFAKVITIIYFACHYSTVKNCSSLYSVTYPLLLSVVVAGCMALQPDFGTMLLYVGIVGMLFLEIPVKFKLKRNSALIVIGVCIIALVGLSVMGISIFSDRQKGRLDFTKPCERIYSDGNQVCNGYIAINNGGLFGKGLGNSTQKYLYLPEAYTDFIFAIIVEELGLITSVGILLLLFLVLWRIFLIAKRSTTARGALICYGVFWYILFHIVINLGGLLGLMPLTGVPLPFLSYGGSYLLCLVSSIALVLRVDYENKTPNAK